MKNKIELKFGSQVFTASFGIGFLGEFQYKEKQTIDSMLKEITENPFYIVPKMMVYSINRGTPDANLTLEQVEELIDDNGGLTCSQLIEFVEGFTKSIVVDVKDVGKSKKPIPKIK